ncbi:hypothetical protein SporoP8_12200 [Sporosarcina ureae]|uniref:hypothetical protein n=1 Tax=Sporosarcina ureae TaxID=1571 RepID=UPI000A160E0C|nr:hypothetical protein [Sporosarcina ureae]ARJ39569.1 hypothetical protein SporoP8_12200 [Sporosarcina ureae]
MKNKTLFATIFGLLVSTTIVKVLNFLKELQISYFYGTSEIVDHFNILMLGPNISLSTIAPAFGLILVAYLSNEKKELIISYKEMLFFCGTILLLFFISIISQTIYSGFSLFEISVSFFISMLFLIQVLLIYYLHSFNAFNEGSISSMIQIIVNITVISLSFFMKSYLLLIVGLIIGLLIQIIYLFNKIIKKSSIQI